MEDTAVALTRHDPARFLASHLDGTRDQRPARFLIVLNTPITSTSLLQRVWGSSQQVICADGGANRVYDLLNGGKDNLDEREAFIPDYITGDLDSLDPKVRDHYESRCVPILHDEDQNSTDFGKAVKLVWRLSEKDSDESVDVIILGSLSGRVDQGLGLLSEMARESIQSVRFWLVSERSLSFMLRGPPAALEGNKGTHRHVISGLGNTASQRSKHVEESGRNDAGTHQDSVFTPNVGIVPVYGPAIISTRGLEWDVSKWETEMGANVSTSNHVERPCIEVETNTNVLFTIETSSFR